LISGQAPEGCDAISQGVVHRHPVRVRHNQDVTGFDVLRDDRYHPLAADRREAPEVQRDVAAFLKLMSR
jgi:hypothetical protein